MNYFVYRVIVAAFFCSVLTLSVKVSAECRQLKFYLIYLTHWNVILNAFTSVFGAILVALFIKNKFKFDEERKETPRIFKIYWFLYSISFSVSIASVFGYWLFVYNGKETGMNNILSHAGNAIVFVIDALVNAHPPRYGHFVYPMMFAMTYTFFFSLPFTLLGGTGRTYNNFIYPALDWRKKIWSALSFSFGEILGVGVTHLIAAFVVRMTYRYFSKGNHCNEFKNNQKLNECEGEKSFSSIFKHKVAQQFLPEIEKCNEKTKINISR